MSRTEDLWERLVRVVLSNARGGTNAYGRSTTGIAGNVPSSLANNMVLDDILRAADEIQDEDPNVARIHVMRENDWTCPKCGNVNFTFRSDCNMRKCNTPKPGSQDADATATSPYGLELKLYKHWLEVYKTYGGNDFQSSKQRLFFSLCNSYKDLLHHYKKGFYIKGLDEDSKIMDAYIMHSDDLGHSIPSQPASRNAFDESITNSEAQFPTMSSTAALGVGGNLQGNSASHSASVYSSFTYAFALGGSLSRSTTPEPQLIARAPSPRILIVGEGRINSIEKRSVNSPTSLHGTSKGPGSNEYLVAALSGMPLSSDSELSKEKQMSQNFQHGISIHQNLL